MCVCKWWFTLKYLWTYRSGFREIISGDQTPFSCMHQDRWSLLYKQGIRVVVLDFDGVLAPYGQIQPDSKWHQLIHELTRIFSGEVYVLSNKPFSKRLTYLKSHFPSLKLIVGVRKKPYPDGLLAIQKQSQVPFESILMVDDRLLTGVLAALIVGARPDYVCPARVDYRQCMIPELWFQGLRWLERGLVGLLSRL